MQEQRESVRHDLWARFRFAVIGGLLSSPPQQGELGKEIKRLAETIWKHPITGDPVMFGFSTIEAWLYRARSKPDDPVGALRRQVRSDVGKSSLNPKLSKALHKQYDRYQEWSYLLHTENLRSLVKQDPDYGPMRSYSTIRRYMQAHGLWKKKKAKGGSTKKRRNAHRDEYETRSYEASHVGSLWHADFHHCSRKILAPNGKWYKPIALGVHDDRSRLACHVQWYLTESTEDFVHGICQAFQKWQLPRVFMTDNGSAMKSAEFLQGLERLGIEHDPTLEYSPHQNGKEEFFWGPLEGRLIAMLKHVETLSLDFLNKATQAWVAHDYNRKYHSEIKQTPRECYLEHSDVLRPCPKSDDLRDAFRLQEQRTQRLSDGTVSIETIRFEIPSRFRHVKKLTVRYARWNLGLVHLVDSRTGSLLSRIYPQDKEANADKRRRKIIKDPPDPREEELPQDEIPPYLREILDRYAESGNPPGYISKPFKEPKSTDLDQSDTNEKEGLR